MMKKKLLLVCLIISNMAFGQITNVNVNINVIGPYSPYITDYIANQNKTFISIVPNGSSSDQATIYFKASIVGDNGVAVYTKSGYKPPQGMQISGGFPKMLTGRTLADYFDANNLIFTKITYQELVNGSGLPEGSYTICVQIFDYATDLPLSQMPPMGCTAPLNIQHVDPPLLLSPVCGSHVFVSNVQNFLINWSYNPGVNNKTQYLLKIVPVLETQNANDAINTMVVPAFFEKIVGATSYLYGPADPKLILGQKYAYRIKAFDPDKKIQFKNNGESEVCTFIYGEKESPKIIKPNLDVLVSTIVFTSPGCGNSPAQGSQFYVQWKDEKPFDKEEVKSKSVKENISYLFEIRKTPFRIPGKIIDYNDFKIVYSSYTSTKFFQANVSLLKLVDGYRYSMKVYKLNNNKIVAQSEVCDFNYKFLPPPPQPQENSNLTIKGQIVYTAKGREGDFLLCKTPIIIKEVFYIAKAEDINKPTQVFSNNPINNSPIQKVSLVTDADGKFSSNTGFKDLGIVEFTTKTESLKKAGAGNVIVHGLSIEISSNYYTPIKQLILTSSNNQVDFGKIFTKAYTFDLTVVVNKGYKDAQGIQSEFENCNVKLYKQFDMPTGAPIFKKNYGSTLPKEYNSQGYVYLESKKTIVSSQLLGVKATTVVFDNLVCTQGNGHHYKIVLEDEKLENGRVVEKLIPTPSEDNIDNNTKKIYATYISKKLPRSKVKGQMFYTYKGSSKVYPLNTTLLLKVCYVADVNGKKIVMNRYNADKLGQNKNNINGIMNAFNQKFVDNEKTIGWTNSNSNGEFEFDIENKDVFNNETTNFSSSQSGEFGWNFGGSIYRCVRVVVNNGYYTNPDDDIFIEPLKIINIGKLTAIVRSVNIKVQCLSAKIDGQTVVSGNGVPGLDIIVNRKGPMPNYFPNAEGNILGAANVPEDKKSDKTISYSNSNFNGDAIFTNIVLTKGEDFAKLWFNISSPSLKGDFSYNGFFEKSITTYDFNFIQFNYNAIYNEDYIVPTITIVIKMFPTMPKIKGRVLDISKSNTGLPYASATLEEKTKGIFNNKITKKYTFTDQDGYFEFKNLDVKETSNGTVTGPDRKLTVEKKGYYYQKFLWMNMPFVKEIGILKKGTQVVIPEIYLTPSSILSGKITDENGKGVDCYVAALGSDLVDAKGKTSYAYNKPSTTSYTYSIQLPPGKNVKIVVWPKDLKYYIDTIIIPEIKEGNNSFDIVVYKRLHRFKVKVYEKIILKYKGEAREIKSIMKNARIEIEGNYATTNNSGEATLDFANTSTKNFTIKVLGPDGSNYIEQQLKVTNYESKNAYTTNEVLLSKGTSIFGKISSISGPLEGATVLVERGSALKPLESITDKYGNYSILGITPGYYKQVLIKISMPSKNGVSYIGKEENIAVSGASNMKDFNLEVFNNFDITDFYGFKLNITKLKKISEAEVIVSGYIDVSERSNEFLLAENGLISFNNLGIKKGVNKNANGMTEGIPQTQELVTNSAILNLKYGKYINVNLLEPKFLYGKTLAVRKNENGASIGGIVAIIDNSFDFPGSYLSFGKTTFYLNEKNAKERLTVSVFKSNVNSSKETYTISDLGGEALKYKFLNFSAESNPATSTVTLLSNGEPRFLMDTKITAHFDNMTPSDYVINLGAFEMNHERILPLKGNQNIKFGMEKWTVEVKNWTLTSDKGGITANEGFVNTDVVTVPFTYFHLQNNLLKIDEFKLTELKLGNIAKLDVGASSKTVFGFDKATGADKKPHWKLTLVGSKNSPAASFGGIEGLESGKKVNIEVLSLISNGENLLSFGASPDPLLLYNVVKFTPSTITSYSDYFTMGGILDLGIPKISSNLTGNIKIVKIGNTPKIEIMPQQFEFEGKGFVKFLSKGTTEQKQMISQNKLVLVGTIEEPGKTPLFKCELSKKSFYDNAEINLVPNQTVNLGGKKLIGVSGQMKAVFKEWDYFTFEGDLEGFSGVGKEKKHIKFTVYGDIKAEGQAIKCDNIETPFGGMELTYNFDKGELIGHMDIDMDISPSLSIKGVANMLFGSGGFYISAAVQVTAPVVNTFNAGILIGTYGGLPQKVLQDVVKYNYNKNTPCYLSKTGLKGFFISGGRELPLKVPSFSVDIPPGLALVSISAGATSGVEVQLAMDFKAGLILEANLLVYAHAWAGIGSIVCTEAKADVKAEILIKGNYQNGIFAIDGCGSLVLKVEGSQKLPVLVDCTAPEISLGTTLGAIYRIHLGSDGFSQSISFSVGASSASCTSIIDCK